MMHCPTALFLCEDGWMCGFGSHALTQIAEIALHSSLVFLPMPSIKVIDTCDISSI